MPRGAKSKNITADEAAKIESAYINQGLSINTIRKIHKIGIKRIKDYLIETNQLRTKEQDKQQTLNNRKKAFIEKYGVDNPMKNPDIAAKTAKYQKDNAAERLAVRTKTLLEKYGVRNAQQVRSIHEKAMRSSKRLKSYVFESGREVKVQGYEPQAIEMLLAEGFNESDLYFGADVPRFAYHYDGVDRKYFPDIYIKSINTIVEVKSEWTLNQQLDKNNAKFDAVNDSSYIFRLMVV